MPAKSLSAEFESVARGPTKGYNVTKLAKESRPASRKGVSLPNVSPRRFPQPQQDVYQWIILGIGASDGFVAEDVLQWTPRAPARHWWWLHHVAEGLASALHGHHVPNVPVDPTIRLKRYLGSC